MGDAKLDRSADQRMADDGVIVVIAERIGDRIGDHDRPREVHDRADLVLGQERHQRGAVGDVRLKQRNPRGDRFAAALGQIVDHHYGPAGVGQCIDRVAADITGAAGDENSGPFGHQVCASNRVVAPPGVSAR